MKSIARVSVGLLAFVVVLSTASFAQGGADTFKAKCASCHGAAGAGDTAMGKNLKLRDLSSAEVQAQSDDELATIITKGKGKMPAYDGKLTKDQVTEVVKYIRTLKK
jgi:cytochrome c551